jgi:hypothetical protein
MAILCQPASCKRNVAAAVPPAILALCLLAFSERAFGSTDNAAHLAVGASQAPSKRRRLTPAASAGHLKRLHRGETGSIGAIRARPKAWIMRSQKYAPHRYHRSGVLNKKIIASLLLVAAAIFLASVIGVFR